MIKNGEYIPGRVDAPSHAGLIAAGSRPGDFSGTTARIQRLEMRNLARVFVIEITKLQGTGLNNDNVAVRSLLNLNQAPRLSSRSGP